MLPATQATPTTSRPDEGKRAIPSLDGLRALSVFAVILGHSRSAWLDRIPFNSSFRSGEQGVAVFFVISGFLITHLLMKELNRDGQINLKRFYFRRTFRIFPPFYFYLLVIAVLAAFHLVQADGKHILLAASYTANYLSFKDVWVIGHSWSLSVEEQFYLLWPACVAFFSRRTNLLIALGINLASPFSRIITYYAWPSMRGHVPVMLHTHLDAIMMGCLLSLLSEFKLWERARRLSLYPVAPILAILFLMVVDTPAAHRWRGMYSMTIGYSLENIAIATILLFVVFRHQSLLGKFLNLRWMRHLGMISYSLYLWQQLFTGPLTLLFPLNILIIVACAEASYLLVERPSFWLREKVQRRLLPSRA